MRRARAASAYHVTKGSQRVRIAEIVFKPFLEVAAAERDALVSMQNEGFAEFAQSEAGLPLDNVTLLRSDCPALNESALCACGVEAQKVRMRMDQDP